MVSAKYTMHGWQLWKFIKGRKKMVITLLAGIIGYVVSDSVTAAAVSGGLVEVGFSLAEYFFKEYQ